jgi:tRNA pseudouridine55 synthase
MGHRKRYARYDLQGLLVVDKPLGWSSMDVVRHVRRAGGNVKTGHAGTLDPLATGVVICCIGKATTLVESLMDHTKIYEATIDLTAFTTTDDLEGERIEVQVQTPPTEVDVRSALSPFVGLIDQKPPAFSALHVDGKRAYDLARQGEIVDLPTRKVQIDSIELLNYDWPNVEVRITCGRGTYIRSIARDLGNALKTGGHLTALRRTASGQYNLSQAVTKDRLEQPIEQIDLIDTAQMLEELKAKKQAQKPTQ